jgi:hypothetical protein
LLDNTSPSVAFAPLTLLWRGLGPHAVARAPLSLVLVPPLLAHAEPSTLTIDSYLLLSIYLNPLDVLLGAKAIMFNSIFYLFLRR